MRSERALRLENTEDGDVLIRTRVNVMVIMFVLAFENRKAHINTNDMEV